jgi:4-alpha-glucanotransferase
LELGPDVLTAFGIEPEYTDIWGKTHSTSPEVARGILRSLGIENFERTLQTSAAREWSRPLDPTLVVPEDADSIRLRVPAEQSGASIKIEIEWEAGEIEHHWFWLPELRELDRAVVDGRGFVAKRIPLSRLRLGYHRIRALWMKEPELELFSEARFIVCPLKTRQPEGRIAGVAVSLYGLRSGRNWGCGDFTDLRALVDALAPAGVDFIALNPLHAIPNRQPYNTSPYLPQCSLYRNFIYLDVERVGESPLTESISPEIETLRAGDLVEYESVAGLKMRALRVLFERFSKAGGSPDFDRYVESEGAPLHDFAIFCALDEAMHQRDLKVWLWRDWPAEYQDPRSPAVTEFGAEHSHDVQFYEFLQWHIDRQLAEVQAHALERGMRIGLYHDLALATDHWGADVWAHRPFYATGCRVGSPPDDFSPHGQDWAFPPPNRDAHRADGYELFAKVIRKTARHGGALRIDHVMRFFRLWWIPDEMPASDGAYVRDYAADLMGILKLESQRGGFIVIGEDLGTVTGEVRTALTEAGILSYRVLWFERHTDGSFKMPDEYPAEAAATTSTHDLPTLAGFFQSRDIEARRAAGLIDEAGYREQMEARQQEIGRLKQALAAAGFDQDPLGFLLSTACRLAIVNQEDLTGETEQQNLPGSTWQHPNWRRKMKIAVEDLGPVAEKLKGRIQRAER